MLATSGANGIVVNPMEETTIVQWTADGNQGFLGFTGAGSHPGLFKLYVQKPNESEVCYYVYQTTPSNLTAYIADRFTVFPAGTVVTLTVKHEDASGTHTFYGTLLGGNV